MDSGLAHQKGVPEVLEASPIKLELEVKVRDSKSAHLVRRCTSKVNLMTLTAEELEVVERPLQIYSSLIRGDTNTSLTKEAMNLMVDGQMHQRGIERRILVDRLIRTEKGCILWLCLDQDAEESMARIDGTINLGFASRVRCHAAGLGPCKKLEEQREHFHQEQHKLHEQHKAIEEKLTVINSQFTSGIASQQAEGVANSLIVPTASTSADNRMGHSNSETTSSAPDVHLANPGCAVEQMEEECATLN